MNKAEREAQIYIRTDPTRKSLEKFSVPELRGITLGYRMRIGNLATKRKADLIKAIQANSKYQTDLRRREKRNELKRKEKENLEREQRRIEQELQAQETIGDIIMQTANYTTFTDADWYANELRSELSLQNAQIGISDIQIGDFLFFNYSARFPQNYKYWDKRPLSFMLGVLDDGKLLGCNVHYLNPEIRDGFAESMLNKTAIDVPKVFEKTLHSYFKTNMSTIFRIPKRPGEYGDIARLITENFVRGNTGFSADLQTVWDSTNNR
tara:strand:- start:1348 stop:2145 length:798 start_codon:yes stop_codon:yes gene_type:complete